MDLDLKDKVALISGGSRGIGKATALALAREGASLALAARDPAALDAAVEEIAQASGRPVRGFRCDTSDDASVRKLAADVVSVFGRIDILVNCAAQVGGHRKPPTLAEVTNDDFWADMNVKVMGYLRTAREVAPHMAKQGSGRIINVSGLGAWHTGNILGAVRNISVVALTKNLADELGPKGISAICVHPGTTRTEKTAGMVERRAQTQGVSPQAIEDQIARGNVLNRIITAEEVANVIVFLASPKAIAVNGDSIAAGGGTPHAIHY